MNIQFFQHHLLSRLSFFPCVVLVPLLKIIWSYVQQFVSGLCILFQWCYVSVIIPTPHCLDHYCFVVCFEIWKCESSSIIICFSTYFLGYFVLFWETLRLSMNHMSGCFFIYAKNASEILIEITLNLQTTLYSMNIFSSVPLLGCVRLFVTPWTAAHQASLSITNSQSSLKLMSIESVMPSSHLILCCPLLLPPSIFPSIRVFSSESVLCIRWAKDWSFSFNISPSSEHLGLISFRMDWLDLLEVQGTLKSLLQHHSSKALIFWRSAFFIVQLSHP